MQILLLWQECLLHWGYLRTLRNRRCFQSDDPVHRYGDGPGVYHLHGVPHVLQEFIVSILSTFQANTSQNPASFDQNLKAYFDQYLIPLKTLLIRRKCINYPHKSSLTLSPSCGT